jgi:hypothetical protein
MAEHAWQADFEVGAYVVMLAILWLARFDAF